MNLFQLARAQLKYINDLVPAIAGRTDEDVLLQNVDIPLQHLSLGSKVNGEAHKGEFDIKQIELEVHPGHDGLINYSGIEQGVNQFVALALVLAFTDHQKNRLTGEDPDVILRVSPEDEEKLILRFKSLQPAHFGVHAAAQALDKVEQLMFKGWQPVPGMHTPMLRKEFASEDDRLSAEYLIECCGRATGYKHEEIEECFDTSPNDRTITIQKDFLEQLAKVEQTLQADFGNGIH